MRILALHDLARQLTDAGIDAGEIDLIIVATTTPDLTFPAAAMLFGTFGFIGLVLASVGLYGVMSYAVTRRTREIGIRMALGAKKAQVLAAVLRQFVWPVAIGIAAGAGIAAAASRVLRIALYGVSNLDPASYAAAILVLMAILGLAALLPARHALRLDLVKTLHYE